MINNTIKLSDGRLLGYALYGSPDGTPVLYFHGTPSSRLEPFLCEAYGIDINERLQQYQLRLIAVDRPGMGLSHFNPTGTFLSFADDAQQLLQHLQISRCSLLCWSGGGPFALAMAYKYLQNISKVCIIAGFSQPFTGEIRKQMHRNKWYFLTAEKAPFILQKVLNLIRSHEPKKPLSQKSADLPDVDYALMKEVPQLKKLMAVTLQEAVRNGSKGAVHEAALYAKPFHFSLSSISVPVHFWWGIEDRAVVYPHAKALEDEVPDLTPHYKPGEGHLSIYINCLNEILQTLADKTPGSDRADTTAITIRTATKQDAELIADMSRQTFYETFAAQNTKENMDQFLREQFTRQKLMAEVGAPENTFLIAYTGNEPAGYVKLRDANRPVALKAADALEIARIYAVAGKVGTGVGRALMEATLQVARERRKKVLWLGVWEKNERAIRFYQQWGFEKFDECDFRLGSDIQRDWLMKKVIG
ncbi:MAG: GNAT family N-acetyltransferase [Flavisolibacter sp.]|nr:GNAT family N-acetyltransferase [Flavisolibacter sp.]MBD0294111.1 GNAT family N-acetyltransferase [Flavisolibacter sp.]MBD0353058.1 GNAT family N-acetyltransferase [Flavisolibacter sp.]MBD0367422.1 GNAT family N-acetyltransferase [Flavisolibacter sp.]